MEPKDKHATWVHGDITCETTDQGVILNRRQKKNALITIMDEGHFLLQIFINPNGKEIEIIRSKDVEITTITEL